MATFQPFIPSLSFRPSLRFNPSSLRPLRERYASYAIASLIDVHRFSVNRLNRRLHALWMLRSSFFVEGQIGNFYIIRFNHVLDRDYVVNNGPWSVDNSLLVADCWRPNLLLHELRLASFAVWVQVWGLPMEYHNAHIAESIGNTIGNVTSSGNNVLFSSTINFLRIRIYD